MSDRNKKQSSGINDILNDDNIQIIRSKRHSLGLEVRPDGSVVVRIPNRLSKKQLMEFLVKHKAWIDEKRHYMMNRQDIRISTNAVKYDEISIEEVVDKKLAAMDLTASIMCLEQKMPMLVFGLEEKDSIVNAVHGKFTGTKVTV